MVPKAVLKIDNSTAIDIAICTVLGKITVKQSCRLFLWSVASAPGMYYPKAIYIRVRFIS